MPNAPARFRSFSTATCSFLAACFLATGLAGADVPGQLELTPRGRFAGAKQPQAAVTDSAVHVAFAAGDVIYVSTSLNAGRAFSAPVQVGKFTGLMGGMRRGPRIVANEKTLVISAIGSIDGNLLAWRSVDAGKTWDGPTTVNSQSKSAREGLHAMALGPDGQIACVWLDLRNQKTELFCSISTDGGASWGMNRMVYQSPDGSICECCHPSVAYDPAGRLYVLWRNSLAGNRDMYVASSTDAGQSFSQATKQGSGTWKRDSCPMDGGALAVAGPGQFATIWRRDKDIFLDPDGSNKEQRLGPGEQPTLAHESAGLWLAWVTRRGGPLMVQSPQAKQPMELVKVAVDPMLASNASANGPVVIVWETGRNRDTSIWFAPLRPGPAQTKK